MTSVKNRANVNDLIERYKSGESVNSIAKSLDVCGRTISDWFHESGFRCSQFTMKDRFDIPAIHAEHVGGKSILQISRETGVSRITLNRWFDAEKLKYRGRSEACYNRAEKMTPQERQALASEANEARRGQIDTDDVKRKRASVMTDNRIGLYEREIMQNLRDRGVGCDIQWPFDIYNIDVFLHSSRVAMEVYSHHPSKARMAELHKRAKHMLYAGINMIVVQVTYPSKIFDLGVVCDKIIAFHDLCGSGEPVTGKYGVIRGNGEIPSASSHDIDDVPRVMSF
jgi:hypothetical protein